MCELWGCRGWGAQIWTCLLEGHDIVHIYTTMPMWQLHGACVVVMWQ